MNNIKFTIINIIILSNLIFGSSDFGKIRGKIIAIEDSTGLIGVNISILDTDLGAVSDEKGNYTIIGISSGVYSVRFDYIGRQSKTFKNIYVESSLSTSLNVQLSQSVIESEAIIVSGARKIIQPDVSVITNINFAHAKNFKNLKNIAIAKSEIIQNTKQGGYVILNADDNFFSSSSGLINLFQSCVPIGNHLKIYSAPTIAFMYETIVLFNVAVNIMPFFFKRLLHDLI